jgi:hypothetical protein
MRSDGWRDVPYLVLGKEIKELGAALTEMEAVRKTRTKATAAALQENSEAEVQRRVSYRRV